MIKTWLLGIVLTAFAGELARQLAPGGKEQAFVRFAAGLLLVLAVLQPLASLPQRRLELERAVPWEGWEAGEEDYQKDWQEALSSVIAEKTQAYIWDKANQLGLACRAEVSVAAGEGGIPLPDRAVIYGPYSGELARCIEEEVGIPAEKLIWLEDEEWQERKESES